MRARDFEVRRDDLRDTRVTESQAAGGELRAGELRLVVDRFGLTANNVTYGFAGDALGYWGVYPGAEPGWGRIPAWGHADVVASRVQGVHAGTRLYGFLPMSSHVKLAGRATSGGFLETSAHRAGLSRFYNSYERVEKGDRNADQAVVLRPLFLTAFLLDHLIRAGDVFGADTVVLSSASSKTAYGLAFMVRGHARVVGLTSERNRAFTEGLGLYDSVVTYDRPELTGDHRFVYVDLSGDRRLRAELHAAAGARLKHSLVVGATHWEAASGPAPATGPRPSFFFAPTYAEQVAAQIGPDEMRRRIATAWRAFLPLLGSRVDVARGEGAEAVREAWLALVEGRGDPRRSHVLSIR